MYNKSIFDIIPKRESWRIYTKEQISKEDLQSLENFIFTLKNSPFSGKTKFKIVELEDCSKINQYATYGFIKNAPSYILGAVKKSKYDIEHFGYLLEKIILKATELNLGTCWLGGTLDRKMVKNDLDVREDEKIPAITPIGYVKERNFKGKLIRFVVKAKKRKDWSELFFVKRRAGLEPLLKTEEEKFEKPLEMIRLGPSAKNKQPWRIVKDKETNSFHFYRADPAQYARLDISIAVCHFDLSSKEIGLKGDWIIKDEKPLSKIVPEDWDYSITWKGID